MQLLIEGRIAEQKKLDTGYITRVQTPAETPYDHPGLFEVRSKRPIGANGSDCKVKVSVRSWPGPIREWRDRGTGEVTRGRPVNVQFLADE